VLIDDVPCVVVRTDPRLVIVAINRTGCALLGRASAELVGLSLREVLTVPSFMLLQTHVIPALASTPVLDEIYLSMLGASGPIPMFSSLRGDERGLVLAGLPMRRRVAVEHDLTQAHDELMSAQSRLGAAQRLASLGELAAEVAHEIHAPLAYVAANLEALRSQAAQDELGPLADVQRGVQRIQGISRSLRTLSRVDSEQRVPIALAAVVEGALTLVRAQAERRAELRLISAEPSPCVLGDEARLGQVVLNLVANAAQAFGTSPREHNHITIELRRVGDHAELSVSDDGPGIPAHLRERIFEPFFTTKPAGEGTGLGLALCRQTATAHGGTLEVEAPEGGGTRFTLRLPLHGERTRVPITRLRVLVVDDDDAMQRMMRRVLSSFTVEVCDDGPAALSRLAEASWDVVVCDLHLRTMTGMDLYHRVIERWPELTSRFVFLTGGATTPAARAFVAARADVVIEKPFSVDELRELIQRVGADVPAGQYGAQQA
jgi:signal transduction histidine kinase/ActR/RegA family two-component response regulator